jgi:hypothetical protein
VKRALSRFGAAGFLDRLLRNVKKVIDPETIFKKPGRLDLRCRLEKGGVMNHRIGGEFDS